MQTSINKLFCFLLAIGILSGCAKPQPKATPPLPKSSQLKQQFKTSDDKIDAAYKASQACTEKLNESQVGKDVAKNVLVLSKTQSNRHELIKSKDKVSPSQKITLTKYLNANFECGDLLLADLKGSPLLAVQEKSNLALNNVYSELIRRKISIGDGNVFLFHLAQANDTEFRSARGKLRLDQMDQVFATEDAEKAKDIADRKAAGSSAAANAALFTIGCSFSKDPKACSAGVLSGLTNGSDDPVRNKSFSFSDEINENIKKQQLIDETKRQMQNDLDYEKKRNETLNFKPKSRQ